MTTDTDRDAQAEARVREHLQPGETLRAAIWVSLADSRPAAGTSRADMSPFRLRRVTPAANGIRPGVHGAAGSRAVALADHLRTVTDPRILARTDRRLLVLAKGHGSWRDVLRPGSAPFPPLRLQWECPGAQLAAATEEAGKAGRVRLTFTDRSAITLLTPAARMQPFLTG